MYLEGGGDTHELHTRCREGFRKLLEKCGYTGRLPRLVACGGRDQVHADFMTAYNACKPGDFIAMIVDSETPMDDIERTWDHVTMQDRWKRPSTAVDEQVLLMTTCMETWILADRVTLENHYGQGLQKSALPTVDNLETKDRHVVQNSLEQATRSSAKCYRKGKRSFEVLGKIDPDIVQILPSFMRMRRILNEKL